MFYSLSFYYILFLLFYFVVSLMLFIVGSFGHYETDANTLAGWGIDFVKSDNCHKPSQYTEIELYLSHLLLLLSPTPCSFLSFSSSLRPPPAPAPLLTLLLLFFFLILFIYTNFSKALNATGRPILFSLCEWGDDEVQDWGAEVCGRELKKTKK